MPYDQRFHDCIYYIHVYYVRRIRLLSSSSTCWCAVHWLARTHERTLYVMMCIVGLCKIGSAIILFNEISSCRCMVWSCAYTRTFCISQKVVATTTTTMMMGYNARILTAAATSQPMFHRRNGAQTTAQRTGNKMQYSPVSACNHTHTQHTRTHGHTDTDIVDRSANAKYRCGSANEK